MAQPLPNSSPTLQRGISLIEVLITIVILAIGLLGISALQITSMRNQNDSYARSLAVQQAGDMAERMQANEAGVTAGNYNNISTTPADPNCFASGCTAAQMAQYDAYEWNTDNAALLSNGAGTVAGPDAAGQYLISVSWDRTDGERETVRVRYKP